MPHKQHKANNYTDFYYYMFRNILIIGIPLAIISALTLSLPHSSANSSGSDNLAITISSSCTLSSVVNIPHSTEVYNGNHLGNIGKTTITTLCNDGNGYSVYATGYSNNEVGNNKLINSSYPQYSIDTGLATSGLTSTWAMKLNNIENDPSPTPPVIETAYNDTYGLVPTQWAKVASRASGTTDMAQGSSFTTTYAVYASSSQYAGTYQGQVKYLLTHPYFSENYIYFMQDVASWANEQIPNVGDTIQAIDRRDYKKYYVARLADGHIWMTQNLDFDINPNTTLDSTTTDLNAIYNSTTGQYVEYNDGYTKINDVIYWTPANTATTIDFDDTTVTDWVNSNTAPYSASKTDSVEAGHASLGNWYNWTAAISSNNSSTLTQNMLYDISNNPKNSICPKGWRLPTISNQSEALSGSTNEFERLKSLYNDMLAAPLFFNKSGFISNASISDLYISGTYLSSSSYSSTAIWGASLKNNELKTDWWNNDYSGRRGGHSIRCIAR